MYLYNLFVFACAHVYLHFLLYSCMYDICNDVCNIYLKFRSSLNCYSGQTHSIAILWVPTFELVCFSSFGLEFARGGTVWGELCGELCGGS